MKDFCFFCKLSLKPLHCARTPAGQLRGGPGPPLASQESEVCDGSSIAAPRGSWSLRSLHFSLLRCGGKLGSFWKRFQVELSHFRWFLSEHLSEHPNLKWWLGVPPWLRKLPCNMTVNDLNSSLVGQWLSISFWEPMSKMSNRTYQRIYLSIV